MSERVRAGLIDLADTVTIRAVDPRGDLVRRIRAARRRRRRWWTGLAGAAVAVVSVMAAAVVGVGAGGGAVPASQPDGVFFGWPVAGNAVHRIDIGSVLSVWDRTPGASPGPHTLVHPIAEQDDSSLGSVVVVEAFDAHGLPRIAFFTGSVDNKTVLIMRADRPAPDPASRQVSLVSARMGSVAGAVVKGAAWGIAVAEPGIDHLVMSSTTVDQGLGDGASIDPASRILVTVLPDDTTALTSTISCYHRSDLVVRTPVDGGAVGDAREFAAAVLSRSADSLTVRTPPVAPAVGDLVATPDGLIGAVAGIDGPNTSIRLVTSSSFRRAATTSLSGSTGVLAGGATGVMFTADDPSAPMTAGNRVVVVDPAEHSDIAGVITAGRATGHGPAYRLRLTADATRAAVVWILMPAGNS